MRASETNGSIFENSGRRFGTGITTGNSIEKNMTGIGVKKQL